jgi:hypothetical protein
MTPVAVAKDLTITESSGLKQGRANEQSTILREAIHAVYANTTCIVGGDEKF